MVRSTLARPRRAGVLLSLLLSLPPLARAGLPESMPPLPERPTPLVYLAEWPSGGRAYLFGTIHVGDPRVLDLPGEVERAFEVSGTLWTELPFDAVAMGKMLEASMLPPGQTLDDLLPEPLRRRLDAYLARYGAAAAVIQRMKPWAAAVQLAMLDAPIGEPLDLVLYKGALLEGKSTRALETLEEQLSIFENLSAEQQIAMLDESLALLETLGEKGLSPIEMIVRLWLAGDGDAIGHAAVPHRDQLVRQLVVDAALHVRLEQRHQRIARALETDAGTTHFVAVGVAHLPGADGVVALLEAKGARVGRVGAEAEAPAAEAEPAAAPRR